eukprot:6709830-Prorocentrum_lima.AAC.1
MAMARATATTTMRLPLEWAGLARRPAHRVRLPRRALAARGTVAFPRRGPGSAAGAGGKCGAAL